jgi:dCMP deaminase
MNDEDRFYFGLAKEQASWSLDPNKKVGCVVERNGRVLTRGFNQFPRGIANTDERWANREYKNLIVIHAESHALLRSSDCYGATLYCTSFLCCTCAGLAIQRGIKRVVVPEIEKESSWYGNFLEARNLLREAGVAIDYV